MFECTKRIVLAIMFCALVAPWSEATWSIVIVNPATREIGIASATCLAAFDLRRGSPVVVVGVGAAAAQSAIDSTGANRQFIDQELRKGTAPAQILLGLAQRDVRHQSRQYGIVDLQGRAVGFTGAAAFAYAADITGTTGPYVYAIQGNILTGAPVLMRAEVALRNTPGDMAAKLMAAMQAARAMGGDGRCSCNMGPTGCGSPPPNFTRSAFIGYMIVARLGDTDGPCNVTSGCAAGAYYMNHNIAFVQNINDPDPVFQLQTLYAAWRQVWKNRPDHLKSTVVFARDVLGADGKSQTSATIALRDWRGLPLTSGGATVTVKLDASSTGTARVGTVTDNGNGTYTFDATAGTTAGRLVFNIAVDDGKGPVLLAPFPVVTLVPSSLRAAPSTIGAAQGGTVTLSVDAGVARAGRPYRILASNAGSTPGFPVGNVTVPLNPDVVYYLVFNGANAAVLPGFSGVLDNAGNAAARLVAPPNLLGVLANTDLTFAAIVLNPLDFVTNPEILRVTP